MGNDMRTAVSEKYVLYIIYVSNRNKRLHLPLGKKGKKIVIHTSNYYLPLDDDTRTQTPILKRVLIFVAEYDIIIWK